MKTKITFIACLLAAALLVSCAAHGMKDPASVDMAAMLGSMVSGLSAGEGETYCSQSRDGAYEFDDDILAGKYGDLISDSPEIANIVKYCAFFADEPYGPEFGVFLFDTEENAAQMKTYIEKRFADLMRNAVNYPSVDTTLAKNMRLFTDGKWVCYSAVNDNEAFRVLFYAAAEE